MRPRPLHGQQLPKGNRTGKAGTIKEIENILQTVKSDKDFQSMGKKEQASVIAKLLQDIAVPKGIELKLRKK